MKKIVSKIKFFSLFLLFRKKKKVEKKMTAMRFRQCSHTNLLNYAYAIHRELRSAKLKTALTEFEQALVVWRTGGHQGIAGHHHILNLRTELERQLRMCNMQMEVEMDALHYSKIELLPPPGKLVRLRKREGM